MKIVLLTEELLKRRKPVNKQALSRLELQCEDSTVGIRSKIISTIKYYKLLIRIKKIKKGKRRNAKKS